MFNMNDLPNSEACERNKGPILEVIKPYLESCESGEFLEIGSLTCQHSAHFAKSFSQIDFITSEIRENQNVLKKCLEHYSKNLKNLKGPLTYEAGFNKLEAGKKFYYTANTLHIMPWKAAKTFIKDLAQAMDENSTLFIYGPFKYHGNFTSPSNEQFDTYLKERDSQSGIRNFEDVCNNFLKKGVFLKEDIAMPANNQLLVFTK
ncbi:hypothetical protein C0Z22_14165 [Halobacteriovorax sp. DA5]|nr:hypothetical protein C0Z22_14165 [Halobacteriovorax sp. DA5]